MNLLEIDIDSLETNDDLQRSGSTKQFEDRLQSSIEQIGLAEPLKVAELPSGRYLVVDGNLRLRAVRRIRLADPAKHRTMLAYEVEYRRRYEVRYQTDIYQDLLPSQLASLVEHLHKVEGVLKADIARYIGVTSPTLRNYTGLWRLHQRGGLFALVVQLMDAAILPSSNPYAWLRLTSEGLRHVIETNYSDGQRAESWVADRLSQLPQGLTKRYSTLYVEATTSGLDPSFYRGEEEARSQKRDLGFRRGNGNQGSLLEPGVPKSKRTDHDVKRTVRHLSKVSSESPDPVLRAAARSLRKYLQ